MVPVEVSFGKHSSFVVFDESEMRKAAMRLTAAYGDDGGYADLLNEAKHQGASKARIKEVREEYVAALRASLEMADMSRAASEELAKSIEKAFWKAHPLSRK
jgi:hypothetical protein